MHTALALLCFVVVMYWLIYPYPTGLLHWHWDNLTIAPVPAKQPWWIWVNASYEFIMNDHITKTKQSTTKPCANFLGYTVLLTFRSQLSSMSMWFCRTLLCIRLLSLRSLKCSHCPNIAVLSFFCCRSFSLSRRSRALCCNHSCQFTLSRVCIWLAPLHCFERCGAQPATCWLSSPILELYNSHGGMRYW